MEYLRESYEWFHQNPELAFKEFETSAFIAKELKKFGFKVERNLGETGLLAILEFSEPGPTLALRSDLDALPVTEETKVPYISKNKGIMHACGHDSHMAILLRTCKYASENKHLFKGTLLAIFQPAEEIGAGAKAMLEAGIFKDYQPDRIIAIHNWPDLPAGVLGLQTGPITANADSFTIQVFGKGGHGALPHQTNDPIAAACAGVQQTYAALQRNTNPFEPRVISFCSIRGGINYNVVPKKVELKGTARTVNEKSQKEIINLLNSVFQGITRLSGGDYELDYRKGLPAVDNDLLVCQELLEHFQVNLTDLEIVTSGVASLIGEDFSYFLGQIPGALLLVGSGLEAELHTPQFLVPEVTLKTGFEILTEILKLYLS